MARVKKAFTLIEVLAAVLILAVVIVPVLKFQADSLATNRQIEQQITSALLAEAEMEKIKAALYGAFETDVTAWSDELAENYLVQRQVTEQSETLKVVEILVGYDSNGDGALGTDEILISLASKIVVKD